MLSVLISYIFLETVVITGLKRCNCTNLEIELKVKFLLKPGFLYMVLDNYRLLKFASIKSKSESILVRDVEDTGGS